MIFFCEDCGEKNDLEKSPLLNGRVVFQCSACGYHNSYAVCPKEKEPHKNTDRILKEICSFSEVIGLFLYNTENGIMDTRMPAILTRSDIETLGREFTLNYARGQWVYQDIEGMFIVISDKHFTVHRIQEEQFIVIASRTPCLPEGVNKLILTMSTRYSSSTLSTDGHTSAGVSHKKTDLSLNMALNMALNIDLDIGRVSGVDQYILVDTRGDIMAQDMKETEKISQLVSSCGRSLSALGKKNFKYATFLKNNNKNLLIFPVGNYYLGVVKQKGIGNAQVADAVMEFLNTHLDKRE